MRLLARLSMGWLLVLGMYPNVSASVPSIGGFASELLEPVSVLNTFIGTGSWIVGLACFFAAFLRYSQYRINPLAAPLSTVIALAIIGLLLICLPFFYLLTGYGIPF